MTGNSLARSGSWWGDRTVKTKVLTAVGVTAAVAGTVGILGLQALGEASAAAESMYEANLLGVAAAADMNGLLSDMRVNTPGLDPRCGRC